MTSADYYENTVVQFSKMLKNLTKILDKFQVHAETKKFDVSNVLTARLAPDQFHFIRQIQIVCDIAKLSCARMSGKEAPVFEDKEQTLDELRARISKTEAYLKTLKASDFEGLDQRKIVMPYHPGKFLLGKDYFPQHVLPNFYFHFVTAYSILRHNGVDLGKMDFLGDMPFGNL